MPKLFEMQKFSEEEQRKRVQEVAERSNKKLLTTSLIQAIILVGIFAVLTELFGEDQPNETVGTIVLRFLIIYVAAVAVWYLTSLIERSAARRRLKELNK